jgi:PAS domain-containing protein
MIHPDDVEQLKRDDEAAKRDRTLFQSEVRITLPSGKMKWIELTSMPSVQQVESQDVWCGVILDITERKGAEEERNQLVLNLQRALADVKTLRGFLPICASCKKIRDDKGYWNQIESYIRDHSEAEFSHGICPGCAKELYPDLDLNEE